MSEVIPEFAALMPATVANVSEVAPPYQGNAHGSTRTGEVDMEFPNVSQAVAFRSTVAAYGWHVTLRTGDAITNFDAPCVLTIATHVSPSHLPNTLSHCSACEAVCTHPAGEGDEWCVSLVHVHPQSEVRE